MDILTRAGGFAAAAVCLITSGCANEINKKFIRELGRPEIIYLQPSTDLIIDQSSGVAASTALYILGGPLALAGSMVGVSQKNALQREAVASSVGIIKSLGFDERIHRMFIDAIDDASWLSNKNVKILQDVDRPDNYTLNSSADSVIYLTPRFSLTSFGHIFAVDVVIGVQQYVRNGGYSHMNTLYMREFSFKHELTLKKPGMTWEQQVNAGHELAQLSPDEATRIWLENDGERMQADFAEDFLQIQAGVKKFLGDETKTSGN